jgi:hypothetical protein
LVISDSTSDKKFCDLRFAYTKKEAVPASIRTIDFENRISFGGSSTRSSDENPLFATPEGVPLGQGTKSQRKRIEKAMLSHMLVPS